MNDNSQKLTAAVSVFLVLATVMWGVLNLGDGLDSSRPPESLAGAALTSDSQMVAARLWQDPFDAIQAVAEKGARAQSGTNAPTATMEAALPLRDQFVARTNRGVAVLGVMLEGTPFPSDKETRRRLRYATEVALLNAEFAPEDRNHVGVQRLAITNQATVGECTVAFEWFNATGSAPWPKSALVLWLREEDFARKPLQTLGKILQQLGMEAQPTEAKFYLIGPRSSDTLRALAEDEPGEYCRQLATSGCFRILSPEATAPDQLLFQSTNALAASRPEMQRRCREALGADVFENWIATDWQLAERLVEELGNRGGGKPIPTGNVVVVVSEADTFYGRSMPVLIEQAMQAKQPQWPVSNLWRFSYLRGLEGIKPAGAEKAAAKPTSSSPEALVAAALEVKGERSEGEAQKDYALRLGELLADQDAALRDQRGRILAVGLTGNDLYDKLVLLHALRRRLPEALFFTTDLDVRLYGPEEVRYTRNLLVASGYGVDPQPPGEHFLPFRDLYQSAVYAACSAAVGKARGQNRQPAAMDLAGHLYEIGRHGPVELDPPGRTISLEPMRVLRELAGWLLMAVLGVVVPLWFASTLLVALRRSLRTERAGAKRAAQGARAKSLFIMAGGAVAASVILVQLTWVISGMPNEEPWSFSEGVSIWTTEFIRFGALLLALAFLVLAPRAHKRHRQTLWKEYFSPHDFARANGRLGSTWRSSLRFLLATARSRRGPSKWRQRLADLRRNSINNWRPVRVNGEVDALALFKGYAVRGMVFNRFLRVAFWTVIYFGFLAAVILGVSGPPPRPCVRGQWSAGLDMLILAGTIWGFLFVLFYALDAARLTGRMLYCLGDGPTRWPGWLMEKWAQRKSVRPTDLDGWLDVRFAADKTRETGRLMFYPFLIFLLLLISRNSYFEDWSWPGSLVAVFALNFILAAACWGLVRHSAQHVRREALKKIEQCAVEVRASAAEQITLAPTAGGTGQVCAREDYAKRLDGLRAEMLAVQHGAYTHWIQDPTYIALFVPTGITGVLTVLLHYWLSRP